MSPIFLFLVGKVVIKEAFLEIPVVGKTQRLSHPSILLVPEARAPTTTTIVRSSIMRFFVAICLLLIFQLHGVHCKAEEAHKESSKESHETTDSEVATTVAATTAAATREATAAEAKTTKSEHGTQKPTTTSPGHGSGTAAEGHIEQSPDSANSTTTNNSAFTFYGNVFFGFLIIIMVLKHF
ncbi:hypothetical protein QR680_002374 [Steinernema hermaphroditum]|uniref:Uncharacterized protein n=1 Tax=Steinernema hermaphroditum TaxID=289476 RepID=A0AA39H4M2_9BILA|nr:hypothetical protein QR680_002374 [Steinernema hermaphroditum]